MAFQKKCLDKMREKAQNEGKTVLYVSHNMNTIRQLCDRCIVLDQGNIIFDGDPEDAVDMYMHIGMDGETVDINLAGGVSDKGRGLIPERLILMDKLMPVYTPDEILKIQLFIRAEQPADHLYLRLTFRNGANVGIGTSWTQPFSLPEPGLHRCTFRMPLLQHARGNFYISLGIYREDESGRNRLMANVPHAFRLEMQGRPAWNLPGQGYVSFPELSLIESEKC